MSVKFGLYLKYHGQPLKAEVKHRNAMFADLFIKDYSAVWRSELKGDR